MLHGCCRLYTEEEMREKKAREGQKDTAEIYERAINEIKDILCEEDIDANLENVVNKFIENEDRNFALFEYINEQNNKIEALKDEIDKVSVEHGWNQSFDIAYFLLNRYFQNHIFAGNLFKDH